MAREGRVNISDLRYFSDTRGSHWTSIMAAALTGAAAAEVGDRSRAAYGFKRAWDLASVADPSTHVDWEYGSVLRDVAAATALAAESNEDGRIPAFLSKTKTIDMRLNYTTTQEKAWMLRAAYELTRQKTHLDILVDGKPAVPKDGAIRLAPSYGQLEAGITFVNKGDASVWRTDSVQGTPSAPLPQIDDGVTLAKAVWTLSGSPADLSNLHQNDRLVIELSGRLPNNLARHMGVIDMLPAGFEIEQTLQGKDAKPYNINDELTGLKMAEKRDDRFVAAFDIGSRYSRFWNAFHPEPHPEFHVAYVVRAVTVGSYVMPAGVVEDMYTPGVIARTTMGHVTIKP